MAFRAPSLPLLLSPVLCPSPPVPHTHSANLHMIWGHKAHPFIPQPLPVPHPALLSRLPSSVNLVHFQNCINVPFLREVAFEPPFSLLECVAPVSELFVLMHSSCVSIGHWFYSALYYSFFPFILFYVFVFPYQVINLGGNNTLILHPASSARPINNKCWLSGKWM